MIELFFAWIVLGAIITAIIVVVSGMVMLHAIAIALLIAALLIVLA